ncbi:MAG: DUF4145 domain-containing protein, partial [Promicromonosporaceae bacterium]|nr:DUF4145 domain-containing protein [Promicromonosporaceae bacterium]
MGNFGFLKSIWPDVWEACARAEHNLATDPRTACFHARRAIELLLRHLYEIMGIPEPYADDLAARIHDAKFRARVGDGIIQKLNLIRKVGNAAVHDPQPIARPTAVQVVRDLHHVVTWAAFHYSTARDSVPIGEPFVVPVIRRAESAIRRGVAASTSDAQPTTEPGRTASSSSDKEVRAQLERLAARYRAQDEAHSAQLASRDSQLAHRDVQIAERDSRLAQSADLLAERDGMIAEHREALANHREEIERLRAQIAAVQAASTTPDTRNYNEAETRHALIDELLREAGWPLGQPEDREYPVTGMPTPSGEGQVDYVLWGDDGRPLAVVEAKRASASPHAGQEQARLYADALETRFGRRPIIFYTNGIETWIWDDAYPPRQVQGFYTKDELERLL